MATVIQNPDSLSFLDNIKAFRISTSDPVAFKLTAGDGSVVIEEVYTPDSSDTVIIDVHDVCAPFLKVELPTSDTFIQTHSSAAFSAYVDDTLAATFTVVSGGVRGLTATASNFLVANWLTWQPQTKAVRWNQPEYLTYQHTQAATVKVKFYLKNGRTETVTLHSASAGTRVTYNMQMSRLFSLSSHDTDDLYGLVDVWVQNASGTRLSYIQRFVHHPETRDEHYYACVNSLGGVDTFCFCGERSLAPAINHQSAQNAGRRVDITLEPDRGWNQNTGYLSQPEARWVWEFLSASSRWAVVDGNQEEITVDSSSIKSSDADNITTYDFAFSLTRGGKLLSIVRDEEDLPLIEVPSPSGEIFFLAPRVTDFQDAALDATLLFIAQSPLAQEWKKVSLGGLCDYISDYLLETSWGQLAHTHSNKELLDRFSENEEHELLFDGHLIGGGVSDYNSLLNRPTINGVTLIGDLTASDLGLLGNDLFEKVTVGEDSEGNPIFAIKAKYALYSVSQVSASGLGSGGGEGTGVDWIQYVESGTHIADIIIDGQTTPIYAPNGGGAGALFQLNDVQLGDDLTNYHVLYYSQGKWKNIHFDTLCSQGGLLSEYSAAEIHENWTFMSNKSLQFYNSEGYIQIFGQQSSQGYALNLYGYDRINLLTRSGGKVYVNGVEITGGGGGGGSYTLPVASSGALGGIKIGYTTSGKRVGLQLDSSSDKAYVELTSQAIVDALGYTPAGGSTVTWTQYVTAQQGVSIAAININGVQTTVYAPVSGGGYTLPVASENVRGGIKTGFENAFNFLGVRVSGENAYVAVTSLAITTALGFTPVSGALYIGRTQVQQNPGEQDLTGIGTLTCSTEVRIGNIRFVYSASNNAVKLLGPDGQTVNLIVSGQSSAGIS